MLLFYLECTKRIFSFTFVNVKRVERAQFLRGFTGEPRFMRVVKPHSAFKIIKNKQPCKIVIISPKDRIFVFSTALDNFPLTVELDISIIHGRSQPFFVLKTKLLNANLARCLDDNFI